MPASGHARREPRNPKTCHERALGLLAVRPRTRRELERRLLAAGFEDGEVQDVLGRLERVGLIDDAAFAEQFAAHQFGSRLAGSRSVSRGLLAKGVDPTIVADVASDEAGDERRAETLARSKVGRMVGVEPARAYGRLTSLLLRRGFTPEVARQAARRALELESADG